MAESFHIHSFDDLTDQPEGVYGEIYTENNAVETAIALTSTWYQVTTFTNNGQSSNVTPDHTSDHLVIVTAGTYLVTASASILSGAGPPAIYEAEVRKNNGTTSFTNIHWDRQLTGGGGDVGSTSMSGLAAFDADDTVELWVQNKTDATNIVFEDINLTVLKVG